MNFTDKKIVVTGGRGFIGSNLVTALSVAGASVYSVDISNIM